MPWSGANSSRAINVAYCRTKCNKLAVIYDNYYFHHNRNYKDGDYWCCAQRGCRVRLISSRCDPDSNEMVFARRNPSIQHGHDPNAPNLIDKEFRRAVLGKIERMSKSKAVTAASMRAVYDETRMEAIRSGIPQSLIPAFWNIRSSMYRIKRKRQEPTERKEEPKVEQNDSVENDDVPHNRSDSELLSVGSPSPIPQPTAISPPTTGEQAEQTEPLCLVKEKNHEPSILLQTLSAPPSAPSSDQLVANLMAYPIDTLIQYSKQLQPMNLNHCLLATYPMPELFQQYAACHAEYLRSLMALNMYRC